MSHLRVLLAGGGTGGHILPALAVARHSAEEFSVGEVVYRKLRQICLHWLCTVQKGVGFFLGWIRLRFACNRQNSPLTTFRMTILQITPLF